MRSLQIELPRKVLGLNVVVLALEIELALSEASLHLGQGLVGHREKANFLVEPGLEKEAVEKLGLGASSPQAREAFVKPLEAVLDGALAKEPLALAFPVQVGL